MKNTIFAIIAGCLVCNSSFADNYAGTGTVSKIRAHQTGLSTNWVTVEGFTSAGNCTNKDNGLVKLTITDDERGNTQLSILLAAKMSGQEVYVQADDATGPTCRLRFIDLL